MSEKTDEGQNRNELEAKLKSKQRTYKILTKLCWVFLPMLAAPFIPAFCGAEDSTWTYRLTGIAVVSSVNCCKYRETDEGADWTVCRVGRVGRTDAGTGIYADRAYK